MLSGQDSLYALFERGQLVVQQAGLQGMQKLLQGDECGELLTGKPEAGQVVAAIGRIVAVAAELFVENQRGAEFVA